MVEKNRSSKSEKGTAGERREVGGRNSTECATYIPIFGEPVVCNEGALTRCWGEEKFYNRRVRGKVRWWLRLGQAVGFVSSNFSHNLTIAPSLDAFGRSLGILNRTKVKKSFHLLPFGSCRPAWRWCWVNSALWPSISVLWMAQRNGAVWGFKTWKNKPTGNPHTF